MHEKSSLSPQKLSFAQPRLPSYNTRVMEKYRWPEFLSSRTGSQIAIENARRAQTWALVLLGFIALAFGLNALGGNARSASALFSTKVLFLAFFHILTALSFYFPSVLQKGEKTLARQLGIRDFTS